MNSYLKTLRNLDKDDLLNLVGLESKRSMADAIVPTLTAFSVGVLVGVGVGLLLAPKPGAELREDLRSRLGRGESNSPTTGAFSPSQVPAPPRAL
ncbi:MAG TPA: hypothetical protein VFA20_00605 [Myxococcaceae bacterium]|nr:hypothetical protein [Myxococcaceae bacterium]